MRRILLIAVACILAWPCASPAADDGAVRELKAHVELLRATLKKRDKRLKRLKGQVKALQKQVEALQERLSEVKPTADKPSGVGEKASPLAGGSKSGGDHSVEKTTAKKLVRNWISGIPREIFPTDNEWDELTLRLFEKHLAKQARPEAVTLALEDKAGKWEWKASYGRDGFSLELMRSKEKLEVAGRAYVLTVSVTGDLLWLAELSAKPSEYFQPTDEDLAMLRQRRAVRELSPPHTVGARIANVHVSIRLSGSLVPDSVARTRVPHIVIELQRQQAEDVSGHVGVRFGGEHLNEVRHVVYVVDRSGSMAGGGAFDTLREQLSESIAKLGDTQSFHVVFFGADKPIEKSPARLVAATSKAKTQAIEFLRGVVPRGATAALPALERAMRVLAGRDRRKAAAIVLLSDGDFDSLGGTTNRYAGKTGNEAVVAWLKDHNHDRDGDGRPDVAIHTFLYHGADPDAKKLMEKIAAQNGGSFTHVTR